MRSRWTEIAIRFEPGDCSVTLQPRQGYVPKSLSTPSTAAHFFARFDFRAVNLT